MPTVYRRFIADAVCPGCGARDTLYIQARGARDQCHCSRCDWQQPRPADPAPADAPRPVRMPES